MKFQTGLILSTCFWTGAAASNGNMAAVYASVGFHAVIWMLHTLEVKLNRLLDERQIFVSDSELAE